jgi:hypothetical protein
LEISGIVSPSTTYDLTTSASGAASTGISSTVGIAYLLRDLLLDLDKLATKFDLAQSYHRTLSQPAQQILAP